MSALRNILAPTDFSRNSSHAIQYACDLAKESGSKLHLLYVSKDELELSDRKKQLERVGSLVDSNSELELNTVKDVMFGNPADAIADYARINEIDLVVMGTHGRTGLKHLALGSVTEQVLRESPCPVTVLGPRDGENASLYNALDVIEKMLEGEAEMEEEMGRGLMARELVDKLRVPATSAIVMVDQLERHDWLKWEDGKWQTIQGREFMNEIGPFFTEENDEGQAIDLIKRAQSLRATDIHIDPNGDQEHLVRFRIDGKIQEYCRLDRGVGDSLINQYKLLSRLEIAEPFEPKEGRVRLPASMPDVEVRMSSVPVVEGEAVALRILDPAKVFKPLSDLGLTDQAFSDIEQMLKAEGMILVTGPTGSGKTTTVYSMLETIGGLDKNIVSIEDPVEFSAPFVRQISVDERHGLTMTQGLRTTLRMDPDALFLGEIRDAQAAQIALRAASSGKHVFSTLHTRDIESTIQALINLGLEHTAIAGNLTGIVNQRLVRRLCQNCRALTSIDDAIRAVFDSNGVAVPSQLYRPTGCSACRDTGFRGRIGVFEVAVIDTDLQQAILDDQQHNNLNDFFSNPKTRTLNQDALHKASEGLISFDEAAEIRWLG